MPALVHAASPISQAAAALLVDSAWQAALLALAVGLVLRALPSLPARLRHAAWGCVLVLSALLPFASAMHARLGAGMVGTAHRDGMLHLHLGPAWSLPMAAMWLLVALLRTVHLAGSAVRLRSLCRRAQPVTGSDGVSLVASGWRGALVCTSDDVPRPSVVGFLAPRILIPSDLYRTLAAADLENVILHEQSHLDRLDDWTNLAQKLLVAVFPLNPALAWMERRLCREREMACDERVLEITRAPRGYAACLVHLAENRMLRAPLSLALGAWERRSDLAERVHQILRRPGRALNAAQALTASVLLTGVIAGGGYELSLAPPLVSFTAAAPVSGTAASSVGSGSSMMQRGAARMVPASLRLPASQTGVDSTRLTTSIHSRSARAVMFPRKPSVQSIAAPATRQKRPPVVLTTWQDPPSPTHAAEPAQPSPRVTFTFVSTYAAVPTENGWLIFQL